MRQHVTSRIKETKTKQNKNSKAHNLKSPNPMRQIIEIGKRNELPHTEGIEKNRYKKHTTRL